MEFLNAKGWLRNKCHPLGNSLFFFHSRGITFTRFLYGVPGQDSNLYSSQVPSTQSCQKRLSPSCDTVPSNEMNCFLLPARMTQICRTNPGEFIGGLEYCRIPSAKSYIFLRSCALNAWMYCIEQSVDLNCSPFCVCPMYISFWGKRSG